VASLFGHGPEERHARDLPDEQPLCTPHGTSSESHSVVKMRCHAATTKILKTEGWMVYRERSCRWYLLGSEALPFPLIGSG